MKKNLLLIVLLLGTLLSNAQRRFNEEPYLIKPFNIAAVSNVNMETSGGSITVEGGSGTGSLEMYVQPSNSEVRHRMSQSDIKAVLDQYYDIDVRIDGTTLIAKARRKDKPWTNKTALSISFVVHSGSRVSSDLSTSGGSISLSKLSGNQLFKTSGGSLHINGVNGKIAGKTSGGSIDLSNAGNDIDLQTSGGSIHADHVSGTIRLQTSGGSLSLSDLEGDIRAHTSGGSITATNISGTLLTGTSGGSVTLKGISGNLEASTSGGRISATMNRTKDYVKLHTSAGGVNLQLPRTRNAKLDLSGNRVSVNPLNNFNGTIDKSKIKGMIGDGRLAVEVTASSGNVEVSL
ncbi:hypothetical protein A8C56_11155 [Niabella ginsenosidivorans]|uniref:DUF4097 domain-containing protein n=1 Tax=Niabella ginsenosidivorans TaxID=1176587 RepID=A0A1A9I934_9BACT|nr:DUF4097 family beta strand repeat-containing protein [Niabella ginsenosidivorans]ANH83865.1 hypothetical protein A8C56_11155 [Niabella ginsenosidivorans]